MILSINILLLREGATRYLHMCSLYIITLLKLDQLKLTYVAIQLIVRSGHPIIYVTFPCSHSPTVFWLLPVWLILGTSATPYSQCNWVLPPRLLPRRFSFKIYLGISLSDTSPCLNRASRTNQADITSVYNAYTSLLIFVVLQLCPS